MRKNFADVLLAYMRCLQMAFAEAREAAGLQYGGGGGGGGGGGAAPAAMQLLQRRANDLQEFVRKLDHAHLPVRIMRARAPLALPCLCAVLSTHAHALLSRC